MDRDRLERALTQANELLQSNRDLRLVGARDETLIFSVCDHDRPPPLMEPCGEIRFLNVAYVQLSVEPLLGAKIAAWFALDELHPDSTPPWRPRAIATDPRFPSLDLGRLQPGHAVFEIAEEGWSTPEPPGYVIAQDIEVRLANAR